MSRWFHHWEWLILALGVTLGVWLVAPAMVWAVIALILALLATVLVVPERRILPTLVSLVGLAGGLVALDTSFKVRQVETNWTVLREDLIELASDELAAALESAVELARDLADSAIAVAELPPGQAFSALQQAVPTNGPESGALLLDRGSARVWAGRHRLDPGLDSAELTARITPFYVLLEARRQDGRHLGIGQVVLAADSAVPDRNSTLAARFAARTGARLEFYPPGSAPVTTDVFDYYLPDGNARDTLFAVRTVPPEQGAFKLDLTTRRVRRTGLLALGLLVLFAPTAGLITRWIAVIGVPVLLVFTPAGQQFSALFSPATFYIDALKFLTASAGHLLVWAALAVVVLLPLSRRGFKPNKVTLAIAVLLASAIPYVMVALAHGITPPATRIGIRLWMSWQMSLALAGSALVLLATLLVGRLAEQKSSGAWMSWGAVLSAGVAAIVGLLIWDPIGGWPVWFPLLWVPAVLMCIAPATWARTVVTLAIVAGAASATLTWAEVVSGRLVLADRDAGRLAEGDNLALVGLDRFTTKLAEGSAPLTGAELYASWRRSLLANDDYPVMLSTWAPGGWEVARLDLARLEIGRSLLQVLAAEARDSAVPEIVNLPLPQGLHYIGFVPFPDGFVVSVAVGPQSRLIEPVRLARFLRGERRLVAPYTMFLGEPDPGGPVIEPVRWRRTRWTVRGDLSLTPPGGPAQAPRHLHVTVPLGGFAPQIIRGVLILSANVLVIGLLWLVGTALGGGAAVSPLVRELAQLRSFRSRLTVALAGFFIIPTLGYAAWSLGRLRAEANASRDLLIQETLSDAAGAARQINTLPQDELRDRFASLATQVNADLLLYDGGALREANPPVLAELGLLDRFLPPKVYLDLTFQDQPEVTADALVGGQPTRVGYRNLAGPQSSGPTLAAPRLVDVRNIQQEQEDLVYGLLLATLVGLGAAVLLAGVAAQSLAKPVQSLRKAALAVGRGESPPPFDPDVPAEFVSVVDAFERMVRDVESSQSALETARRRTAAVLKNVATGVVAMNRELRVTIANPRAEELLGVAIPSGARVDARVGPEWDPLWRWVQEFLDRGAEAEAREFTVDAKQIRAQVVAIHGRPGGCVVALDDTTELARAVRILAWGELARQVAHEIKNPLTPIRLGIQHLKRAHGDAREDFQDTLDRTAQQILAEIERLDAIARAFARFGAPPAEAAPLAQEDLTTIARDTAELYALAEGTSVGVEANDSVIARVRRDEVKEVLVNLVENARDAGATEIAIRIGRNHQQTVIEVVDNGAGIAAEDLPHVFEPQFSTTTSGTGLGLAICKRLVESWGGRIEVESERSQGTRVLISLNSVEANPGD